MVVCLLPATYISGGIFVDDERLHGRQRRLCLDLPYCFTSCLMVAGVQRSDTS